MGRPTSFALHAFGLLSFAALLDSCSGGSLQPSLLPPPQSQAQENGHPRSVKTAGYIYVSNRTRHGTSQLLVYRAGSQDPSPMRTVTQDLVDATGVAVDSSGNVYVANGAGRNVLEFSPGGASLVFTYSKGLVHPVGVTVSNDGTLYVTDQGDAEYGFVQQVFEYKIGSNMPFVIGGYGTPPQLNEGIALDSVGSGGAFFVSASAAARIPPSGDCSNADDYPLGENELPTLWGLIPLSHTDQPSGLAFDSRGNLYVADVCLKDVSIYSDVDYTWTYTGDVPGTFSVPLFLTINADILAIPSYGANTRNAGYVSVIDLSGKTSSITITNGLQHPVGAAAFY
ncbi:MAG: hypothetical protein WAL67_01230 [Candidatus Cybelea sp.]